MDRITVKEIEHVAFRTAREIMHYNEPIPDFKTRYPDRLKGCLSTPFQTFDKKNLYPSFISKISILFYLMIKNHPFQNGNKRIAMTTLFYALLKKGKWLSIDNQSLYNFAIWVTESPPDAKEEVVQYIEKFLKSHIIKFEDA